MAIKCKDEMDISKHNGTTYIPYPDDSTTGKQYGGICKCCNGAGVQTRNDGITIRCPCCGGSGNWDIPEVPRIMWEWIS